MVKKISRADRMRLAVALTALRFKPGSLSIAAYVFNLRSVFPAPVEHASRDQIWRSRLSELEIKISQLEAELDSERIKSIALSGNHGDGRSASTGTAGHLPSSALSTNGKDKKSRKKNTAVKDNDVETCYCLDLKGLQTKAPPILSTVFATMEAFSQLVSLGMHSSSLGQSTVTSITLRSVEVIADSLHSLLLSKNTRLEHLEILNSLLQYVLAHGISFLFPVSKTRKRKRKRDAGDEQYQGEPIHGLLEILQHRIFIPAIVRIYHLSESYLSSLLCPKTGTDLDTNNVNKTDTFQKADTPTDIRRGILLFLQNNTHMLFSSISSAATGNKSSQKILLFNFRTSLILATLQELDAVVFKRSSESMRAQSSLFHPKCRDNNGHPRFEMAEDESTIDCSDDVGIRFKTRNDPKKAGSRISDFHKRVKHLATKDTVWYLCSVLHLLLAHEEDVGLASNDGGCEGHGINSQRASLILSKATDEALFSFMTKCQRMRRVGEWGLSPPYLPTSGGVHSANYGNHAEHSSTEIKSPHSQLVGCTFPLSSGSLTTLYTQTGSEAKPHGYVLAQRGGQGDQAQEHGIMDSVTYEMILAAVERFLLGKFPRM